MQRLSFRAWKLRYLADQLEQACEERIQVPTLDDFYDLDRTRGRRIAVDLPDSDE